MQDIRHYAREARLALQRGASLADRVRLLGATARFHLGNARHARVASAPRRYRVRLLGRPHDLWLRTHSGDLFVLYEVFLSRCYDIPGFDVAKAALIVDLGANIGLTTLYFAGRSPLARFLCVEPLPGNAALLRRNLASVPGAIIVEAAAGMTGPLSFDDSRPAWGGFLSPGGRITVEAVSMDDLLQAHAPNARVDLLKMDIEGGEQEVLAGPAAWLDRVDCIVAELHPPFTFERFRAVLTERGFAVYEAGAQGHAMPTALRPGARCATPGFGVPPAARPLSS